MTDKQKVMLDAAAEALDSLSFGAPSEPQPPQPLPAHTPGPWRCNEGTHTVYYLNPRIESGEMSELEPDPRHDSIIASTVPVSAAAWSSGISDEEAEANARLIAAAPALLEALQHCEEFVQKLYATKDARVIKATRTQNPGVGWNWLCSAIAQATGE